MWSSPGVHLHHLKQSPPVNTVSPGGSGFTKSPASGWYPVIGGGYCGQAIFTYVNNVAPGNSGRWTFDLTKIHGNASYEVQAYIPSRNAGTKNAVYHINTASGSKTHAVNQYATTGWANLGTYSLTTGSAWVELNDDTGEAYAVDENHEIAFDSVKLTYVGPSPDTTVPTTTVSGTDTNWHKTAVTVTLTATDNAGGSGVKATYYTIDGTQHTYSAPFAVSAQGSHAVTYWSVDKAGNTEIAKTCTVKIDTTTPTTTVSGTDVNWHKTPVTVTLTASDAGGSGVKATYYTIDGTQHTYAAPFAISSQGSNTVTYWSVDNADNTEIAKSATVNIDTTGPVTAAKAAKGKAGHALKLSYQISDNLSPTATGVKLVVKNSDGKVVKTLACGTQSVTVWHTASWTPKAKGTYSYAVYAKDLAGNVQSTAGSAKIKVK